MHTRANALARPKDASGCSCRPRPDRKSTRLNSSHANNSYAVFCLKKKKTAITKGTGKPEHHMDGAKMRAIKQNGKKVADRLGSVCIRARPVYITQVLDASKGLKFF